MITQEQRLFLVFELKDSLCIFRLFPCTLTARQGISNIFLRFNGLTVALLDLTKLQNISNTTYPFNSSRYASRLNHLSVAYPSCSMKDRPITSLSLYSSSFNPHLDTLNLFRVLLQVSIFKITSFFLVL